MVTVVPVDGKTLPVVLAATPSDARRGLDPMAFSKFDAAQARTVWGGRHRRRFALVSGGDVLASAEQYELEGSLDGEPITVCGIAAVATGCTDDADQAFVHTLVAHIWPTRPAGPAPTSRCCSDGPIRPPSRL